MVYSTHVWQVCAPLQFHFSFDPHSRPTQPPTYCAKKMKNFLLVWSQMRKCLKKVLGCSLESKNIILMFPNKKMDVGLTIASILSILCLRLYSYWHDPFFDFSSRAWRWHVTVGGDSHREILIFCHRHRHRHRRRKKNSPSPSPSPPGKKNFTVTVTVTAGQKYFHRHRHRGTVTVTTVLSPPVTCHRHALKFFFKQTFSDPLLQCKHF